VKILKKNKEDQLQKIRNENREKHDELTRRLVVTSNQQASAEREIQSKEKDCNSLRLKNNTLRLEIENLKVSEHDVENLKSEVQVAQVKLDDSAIGNDDDKRLGELEKEVQQMDTERLKKRDVLKRLNLIFEKVVLMQQRSKDLDDLQRQVEGKVQLESRNILRALNLTCMPDLDTLSHKLNICLDQCTRKDREESTKLHGMQGRLMALEVQRNRFHADLEEVKLNLKAAQSNLAVYEAKDVVRHAREKKISLQCAIEVVETEINEELKLNIAVEHMGKMFEQYQTNAKNKSCCPLCDRPFKVVFLLLIFIDLGIFLLILV
jgi:hypothetical protein